MQEQDGLHIHQYLELLGPQRHTETDLDPEIVIREAKKMEDLAESTFVPKAVRGRVSQYTISIPLRDYRRISTGKKLQERTWRIRISYKNGQRSGMEMFVGGNSPYYRISSESQPPEIYWTENIENRWNELENYSRKNDPAWIKHAGEKLEELVQAATNPQTSTDSIT